MKAATKDKRLKALDAKIARLAGIKDKTANRNRTANAEYDAALQERTLLRNWPVTDADEATDVDAIDTEENAGPGDDSKPDNVVENSDVNEATGIDGVSGEQVGEPVDGERADESVLDTPVEPGDDDAAARENSGRRGGRRAKSE